MIVGLSIVTCYAVQLLDLLFNLFEFLLGFAACGFHSVCFPSTTRRALRRSTADARGSIDDLNAAATAQFLDSAQEHTVR